MKKHYPFLLLFICQCYCFLFEKECEAQTDIHSIVQDDIYMYELKSEQTNQYVYHYPQLFSTTPSVSLHMQSFQWKIFIQIDFWIEKKINKEGLIIELTTHGMEWAYFKVHLWITEIKGIETGTIVLNQMEKQRQIQNIENATVFYSLLCAKVSAKTQNFSLKIKDQVRRGRYFLSVQEEQTRIEKVSISYISIKERNSYSITLNEYSQHFEQKRYYQFIKTNHPINYRCIGIKSIIIHSISNLSLQFDIEQASILSLSSSQHIDIEVNLLSIGPIQQKVCEGCQGPYTYYYSEQKKMLCVKECPPETITNQKHNNCDTCSPLVDKEVNMFSSLCQCIIGFKLSNEGKCMIDPSSPFKAVAPCKDSHAKRNWKGQCQCSDSFQINQLGKCEGLCLQNNTRWDKQTQQCMCLPGFSKIQEKCQKIKECGVNQVFMNGVCECDTNTIWDRNHLNCIVCPAGTYKDIHDCKKCPDGCSLCFSSTVCFECGDGYDLREQKCIKQAQGQGYVFKLAKRSPVYTSPGIIIDMIILPAKKKTEEEIQRMFKIQISQRQAEPPQIFLSQDAQNYEQFRCFLFYQGQLPWIDFDIQILVSLQEINETKSLMIHSSPTSNSITSAVKMDDQDERYIF